MSRVKELKFGEEARKSLLKGMDILVDAIASTIGPKGRDVIIDNMSDIPATVTNDGVTIAREITLKDPYENLGAKIIKEAAGKTNDDAGDGTSLTSILTREIVKEAHKMISAGHNEVTIKESILKEVAVIVSKIRESSQKIEGDDAKEKLRNIASISGQDERVGEVLADVFDQVGIDSVITIEDSAKPSIEFEITDGFQIPLGQLSNHFYTDKKQQSSEYQDVNFFISSAPINSITDIGVTVETLGKQGIKKLIVIAPSFSNQVLDIMALNHVNNMFSFLPLNAPYVSDRQKAVLEDIAIVTGARLIDDNIVKFKDVTLDMLGKAKKVISGRDKTVIMGGEGENEIPERIAEIKEQIEMEKAEYLQEQHKERIASLGAGIAIIRVGAQTEIEQKELKYKVEDAINATRSAIEEGYLPGGGVSLVKVYSGSIYKESDGIGAKIIRKAVQEPLRMIAKNAGAESPDTIIKDVASSMLNYGWNAVTNETGDMIEMGIIDPTKVVCSALLNAASAAATVIATNTAIIIDKEELPKQSA